MSGIVSVLCGIRVVSVRVPIASCVCGMRVVSVRVPIVSCVRLYTCMYNVRVCIV